MEPRSESLQELELQQANISKVCLDKATLCFLRVDSSGRIVYANPYACKTFGYPLNEFTSKWIFDIDPAITRDNWSERWNNICEQSFRSFETINVRKDGSIFPVEVNIYLFEVEGEKTVGAFVRDISTRKKVEAEALLTEFIFNKVSIAIIHGDEEAKILKANDFACSLYGYTKEELCKLTIPDLDPYVTRSQLLKSWNEIQKKSVSTYETTHKKKDGTLFPVEITSNALEYEGKRYAISFIKDITVQKQLKIQKDRADSLIQKTQRLEALGTLAGGIAHDFNNILSGILGYAELAGLNLKPDDENHKYLKPILAAGNRAKLLVQRILAFSRQGDFENAPIDIGRAVGESLDLVRATIPTTIEIKRNIQSDIGFVVADETLVHQVVMNLCTNGYQAMENDGGILEIELSSSTIVKKDTINFPELNPGEYIKLVVTDTGHGMDKKTMDNIYNPYFTTRESGEGTGLGLFTVHGIVNDLGGAIKAYSEVNIGTTFQIFLPLDRPAEELSSAAELEKLPYGSENILLVDDEEILLNIGRELLEGLGYTVETRASSIDALEAVKARPKKYDLIYSDLTMPHITGDVLAQKVKELRPDLPVILATGYSTRINRERFKDLGVSEILMKPVTFYEMANAVRKAIDENMGS